MPPPNHPCASAPSMHISSVVNPPKTLGPVTWRDSAHWSFVPRTKRLPATRRFECGCPYGAVRRLVTSRDDPQIDACPSRQVHQLATVFIACQPAGSELGQDKMYGSIIMTGINQYKLV